jgi:hypothetical protein
VGQKRRIEFGDALPNGCFNLIAQIPDQILPPSAKDVSLRDPAPYEARWPGPRERICLSSRHVSILTRIGASGKSKAVQRDDERQIMRCPLRALPPTRIPGSVQPIFERAVSILSQMVLVRWIHSQS